MRKGRNNGLAVAKQKDNNYFTEIYYIPSDFDVLLVCIIYRLVERLSIKTSTKRKRNPGNTEFRFLYVSSYKDYFRLG